MTDVVTCTACAKKNRIPTTAQGVPRCASCHAALPWLVEADATTFAETTGTKLPVLVDLWAPWCAPCRTVAPGVARAAQDFAGRLKVVKVDVDVAPAVSAQFGVQGIPTLLILQRGQVIARQVGALPAERLLQWVRDVIDAPR